jgi:hypothetical protein
MSPAVSPLAKRRGHYGVDAPTVLALMAAGGTVLVAVAVVAAVEGSLWAFAACAVCGVSLLLSAAGYIPALNQDVRTFARCVLLEGSGDARPQHG